MAKTNNDMALFLNCLKSFETLRDKISLNPVELAHAGFYNKDNLIKCHVCKLHLRHLEDIPEPFFEHAYKTQALVAI